MSIILASWVVKTHTMVQRMVIFRWGLLLLVALLLVANISSSISASGIGGEEGEEYVEGKVKAEKAQEKAAEAGKEAKEASESWAGWAKEKLSEGLGFKTTNDDDDAAKLTKDKIQGTYCRPVLFVPVVNYF